MINGQNIFDQSGKSNLRTYDSIRKVAIGQGDHYTTGCLLDHNSKTDQMIAIDLSKQQTLGADQVNLTENLSRQ